jgi:hydrogenase nickel incorporation protein HypA/HybF
VHEFHIVEALFKKAVAEAEKKKALRVKELNLCVGEHSGLEEGAVRMFLETLAQNSVLENARIVITKIPSQLNCRTCGKNFTRAGSFLDCPNCGRQGAPTGIGKEFYIESMTVE